MRRALTSLVLAGFVVSLLGVQPATAETKTWSKKKGVVKSMTVDFGQDTLRLSGTVRKAKKQSVIGEVRWFLKTTADSDFADFMVYYGGGGDFILESMTDTPAPECPGFAGKVKGASVKASVPASCLVDGDGAEPQWVKVNYTVNVQGMRHGEFYCDNGAVPGGEKFTPAVDRGSPGTAAASSGRVAARGC